MPTQKRPVKSAASERPERCEHDDSAAVSKYLEETDHPMKSVMESMRSVIMKSDRRITEGIKWNSPSFYLSGWFATMNLRSKESIVLVLHHGAKVKKESRLSKTINDPSQLLKWPAADRATITFTSAEDFTKRRKALIAVIKQWAEYQFASAKGV